MQENFGMSLGFFPFTQTYNKRIFRLIPRFPDFPELLLILAAERLFTMCDEFLNVSETAEFLRVSKATIYDWIYKRLIPFRKHGSRVIFWRQDLLSWSLSNEIRRINTGVHDTILKGYKKGLNNRAKSSLKTEITTDRPC